MTTTTGAHQRWETRVIHLNIDSTPPAPPVQGPQPSSPPPQQVPPPAQNPLFSESYLKQEFPDHYTGAAKPGAEQSQHPAAQLQGFINGFGQEGWEFIGIFPVGQLVMMFFRRPQLEPQGPPGGLAQDPVSQDPVSQNPVSQEQPLLQQILKRLEALEAAPSPLPNTPIPNTPLPSAPLPNPSGRPRADVLLLNPLQLQQLPAEASLPTTHAATALGLRSPSALLNYGSRHGFPIGLVKRVANGMAAVYLGTEKRQGGGSLSRLWKVLPQSSLP